MQFVAIAGGIAVAATSPAMLAFRRRLVRRIRQIASQSTTTAKEIRDLSASVAAELGAGQFSDAAEVKGVAVCDAPVQGTYSARACIASRARLVREYEEQEEETDSGGTKRTRLARKSETVESHEQRARFAIDDGSGTITIEPEGAELVMVERFEEFRPDESSVLGSPFSGSGTLGYRRVEEFIPVGARLFVLGRAADSGGELSIRRFEEPGHSFIISAKQEEDLLRRYRIQARALAVGGLVAAPAGLALVALGLR